MLKILLFWLFFACTIVTLACQSSTIAVYPNSQDNFSSPIYACSAKIGLYDDRSIFTVDFDFADRKISHLPILVKASEDDRNKTTAKLWDALYGTDGTNDYWTTPILREYSLERTDPLIVIRKPNRNSKYESITAELNDTLVAKYRKREFPVTCTLKTIADKQDSDDREQWQQSISEIYTCRTKITTESNSSIDVEFDYLNESSLQSSGYPYSAEPIYIKIKSSANNNDSFQYMEALEGSDGDYSFWTTPVLRNIAGGRFAVIIVREPGIIVSRGAKTRLQQVNEALTVDFADRSYSVRCSQ